MKIFVVLLAGFFLGLISARYYFDEPGATATSPVLAEPERVNAPQKATLDPAASPATERPSATSSAASSAPASAPVSLEKRRVLDELTEDDIDLWRKIRSEKIAEFLKNNAEYWHTGHEAEKSGQPGRLDLAVLRSALGKYDCRISFEIHETKKRSNYKFLLDLKSAGLEGKNGLKMEGGSQEGSLSMASDFSWRNLGTDGRELSVVWNNPNGNDSRYVSNFAFKFRSDMALGEKATARLMGLGPNLAWFELGTIEIKKVR